ncbi:MAG: DUF11 domain-containing protein [Planctomycetia bacterium]|nr:DUF11 domain-containing protein [Planctomycetia bacterium]
MKRIIVRLAALTTVVSLGALAVVQAQRSASTGAAKAAAEPAELSVSTEDAKPMPPPVEVPAQPERYAQYDNPPQATAVDPFSTPRADDTAGDRRPLDSPGIPTAEEAMRRYNAHRAPRELPREATQGVRPLNYEEGAEDREIPSAEVVADDRSPAPRNEPTLAPPRGATDREVAPEPEPFADNAATAPPAADPFDQRPVSQAPASRYQATSRGGRAAASSAEPREPPLLDSEPDSLVPQTPVADNNFTPPARARSLDTTEGIGRPGNRQLEGQQAPSLTLEKIAPAEVQVGKPAVFVLKIRNTGQATAVHVEVHDQIPKGTQLVSTTPRASQTGPGEVVWALGALKPGEETSVELELMPTAEGEVGSVATVRFAAESSARTMATKPVLALEMRAPREVMQGEDVTMAIKVTNTGTGAATGVILHETVPDLLQHPAGAQLEYEVGVLRPGESRELDLTMRAVKAGRIVNALTAQAEGNVRVDQQTELEVIAPALTLKMDGPARRYLDRQATYTVSVSNPGTAAAKEVALVTYLPAGLKFIEANNAGQYNPQDRSVRWLLDELPPSETGSVTLTTVPVEVGEQLVRVESTAERGLAAQEEKKIVIEGVPAIFFEVVDVADPIEVGGETAYEVRVVNQGTKAAANVQVVVLLPEELKPVGAEGPARYTIDGQRVLFEGLAQLAPKADTTYRIKAQGLGPGDVRVRVQVLTDEIRTPITKEESTRVYADE